MKVAIIQEWLVTVGGSDKVVKAIADVFPDADVRKHRFPTFPDKDRMNGGSLHLAMVFNVLMISFVF